jgi:hypothetical protein
MFIFQLTTGKETQEAVKSQTAAITTDIGKQVSQTHATKTNPENLTDAKNRNDTLRQLKSTPNFSSNEEFGRRLDEIISNGQIIQQMYQGNIKLTQANLDFAANYFIDAAITIKSNQDLLKEKSSTSVDKDATDYKDAWKYSLIKTWKISVEQAEDKANKISTSVMFLGKSTVEEIANKSRDTQELTNSLKQAIFNKFGEEGVKLWENMIKSFSDALKDIAKASFNRDPAAEKFAADVDYAQRTEDGKKKQELVELVKDLNDKRVWT